MPLSVTEDSNGHIVARRVLSHNLFQFGNGIDFASVEGEDDVIYTKSGGNKSITINKKTGKVTIKKNLKKGKYKVKIKVTAAGNSQYKAGSKTVIVTIKVN